MKILSLNLRLLFTAFAVTMLSGMLTTITAQVSVPKGKKVWFITGSSRGFGFEFAKAALDRGDYVAASSIEPERVDVLKKQYGNKVLAQYVDVTDRAQVFKEVQAAKKYFGRIDILISNAGYGHFGAVEEFTDEEFRKQLEVNLFGSFNVIQAVLPIMREQKSGRIIQLSSNGGIIAMPLVGAYNTSKWGIEGLCDALADEVSQFGIHVTLLEPGSYKTNFMNASRFIQHPVEDYTPLKDYFRKQIDPNSFGDAKDVAKKLLKIVDADKPPVRVIVGKGILDMVKKDYAQRIAQWEEWDDK